MTFSKRTLAGTALLAALAAGATVPAFAQSSTGDTATEQPDDARRDRRAAFAAALAEELGLDAGTVAAALDTVQADLAEQFRAEHRAALEDRLDAAVAEGTLTQEQADALLAAHDAGVLGGFGGHGFGGRGFRGPGLRGRGFDGPGFGFGFGFGFGPAPSGSATDAPATGTTA